MRRNPLLLSLLSFTLGTAAIAGCTSLLGSFDEATVGGPSDSDGATVDTGVPPNGDSGGGGDAPSPADGAGPADADDGGKPPTCTPPEVLCGTGSTAVCANLNKNDQNCGKCGRSCGGGTCAAGACPAVTLFTGTSVGPITIDDTTVYFESDEDPSFKLLACPKTGCKVAPRQVTVMPFSIDAIDVPAAGTIAFISAPQNGSGTERPAIFSCPTAGCPSPPVSFIGDGLNGFESRLKSVGGVVYASTGGNGLVSSACAAGACTTPATFFGPTTRGTHGFAPAPQEIFFVDSPPRGSAISKCAVGDTACVPAVVTPGDASLVEALVAFGGKLFWLIPGRSGFTEGKLVSCDLPACASVQPVAVSLDSPTGLIVDAGGAWWFTAGLKLQHCLPNGCTGGQQDVVAGLVSPHGLVADAAFVYWAEKTTISLIAK